MVSVVVIVREAANKLAIRDGGKNSCNSCLLSSRCFQ